MHSIKSIVRSFFERNDFLKTSQNSDKPFINFIKLIAMLQQQFQFLMPISTIVPYQGQMYAYPVQQPAQISVNSASFKNIRQPKNVPVKGTWSFEEDEALRKAVSGSQPILWDDVAKQVKGRTPKQCRERWLYRLHPELKKTPFEKWEDELIYEQKKKIGNRWTQIAMQLPGRTSCSVKNRWYTVLRNRHPDVLDSQTSSDHDQSLHSSIPSRAEEENASLLSIQTLLNH